MSVVWLTTTKPEQIDTKTNPDWLAFDAFSRLNRTVICVAAGNEAHENIRDITFILKRSGALIT